MGDMREYFDDMRDERERRRAERGDRNHPAILGACAEMGLTCRDDGARGAIRVVFGAGLEADLFPKVGRYCLMGPAARFLKTSERWGNFRDDPRSFLDQTVKRLSGRTA